MPTRYADPVDLLEADDGVTVTFPDLPEAISSSREVRQPRSRASTTSLRGRA